MSKKHKILMLINFGIISIAFCNLSIGDAALREWNAGEAYLWGVQSIGISSVYNPDENLAEYSESTNRYDYELNVTAIDTLNEIYDAYWTSGSGDGFINDRDFSAEDLVNDELDLGSFFSPNYVWDYEHNRTVCIDIETTYHLDHLIQPNWVVINQGYKDMLNGSEIIETVNDPYSSLVYNFTLRDVMESFNTKINGKSTFDRGWNSFTEDRTKWTFEYDLSNIIHEEFWNGTMDIYIPYDVALITLEIEFTEGGMLKNFLRTIESKISYETLVVEAYSENKRTLGGMASVQANFATFAAISGFALLATASIIFGRRKK